MARQRSQKDQARGKKIQWEILHNHTSILSSVFLDVDVKIIIILTGMLRVLCTFFFL